MYQGVHSPLVTEEVFNKVQFVKKRRAVPKLKINEYKFVHILNCGLCGKRLRSTTSKHRYHYYYCRNKQCDMKPIREELVEKWILSELKKIKFTTKQVDEMISQAHRAKKSLALTLSQRRESIRLQIDQAKSRLSKLLDRDIDGEIPKEIYIQKRNELTKDIANFETELIKINPGDNTELDHKLELANLLADPVYAYKKADWEQKRRLIDCLLKNIRVSPDGLKYDPIITR